MAIAGENTHENTLETLCDRVDSIINFPVDFVKLDFEGHEPHVMRGLTGVLEHQKPVMLAEISQYWLSKNTSMDGKDYFWTISGLGYDCFRLDDRSMRLDPSTLEMDLLENIKVLALTS